MLSSRSRYAMRALLEIALCQQDGPVQIQEIAERQNIPFKYLQQIMVSLRLMGFVQSKKGPGGGYILSKPPAELTLGAVIRALDGPLAPISCASVTQFSECGCPDAETCTLRAVFRKVRDTMSEVLDNTSFQDLVERHQSGAALSNIEPETLGKGLP